MSEIKDRREYVPGNPGLILQLSGQIKDIGTDFQQADQELRAIQSVGQNSTWEGNASLAFEATIGDLPEFTGFMYEAHFSVANAIKVYGDWLAEAHEAADRAINRARAAEERRNVAKHNADAACDRLRSATSAVNSARDGLRQAQNPMFHQDPASSAQSQAVERQWAAQVATAQSRVTQAQIEKNQCEATEREQDQIVRNALSELEELKAERTRQETICEQTIRDNFPNQYKDKSRLQKIGDSVAAPFKKAWEGLKKIADGILSGEPWKIVEGLRDVMDGLAGILDLVAVVLTVVAVIASAVALVFPPAAAVAAAAFGASKVLTAASALLKVGSLMLTTVMAASNATVDGERVATWGDVGASAFSATLGVVAARATGGYNPAGLRSGAGTMGSLVRGRVDDVASAGIQQTAARYSTGVASKAVTSQRAAQEFAEKLGAAGLSQGAVVVGKQAVGKGVSIGKNYVYAQEVAQITENFKENLGFGGDSGPTLAEKIDESVNR